jgi:Cu(I)/Ag(I) efflux system membrane fusion protein
MKRWLIILSISFAASAAGLWVGKGLWTVSPQPNTKVRSYQDSMHPWVKSDRPGTCPICRMELTPTFEGETLSSNSMTLITLSRDAVTVANVAVEPVLRRDVNRSIRVSGAFEAQESRTAIVAAPAGGRIDFIAVDHPGMEIHQGETLVRLFSPDLAQRSRFLRVAMSNQPPTSTSPSKAAQLPGHVATLMPGMTNENTAPAVGGYRLELFISDLTAPISGIVSERPATLGQYVMEGQKIATVIDPSVLWFRFDAFDRQLRWILPGQRISIQTESDQGNTWAGTVAFIEPVYGELRGFSKVRAVVTNTPAHSNFGAPVALRPGMLGEGTIVLVWQDVLAVPKSAVVYPGSSAWVYVAHESRSYERRRIRLGREGDDGWEILSGLNEGERVVTTGNVLVDAQATLENGSDELHSPADDEGMPNLEDSAPGVNRSFSTSNPLSVPFREALARFITASDRLTTALGRDKLDEYNRALQGLPVTAAELQKVGRSPRWMELASAVANTVPKFPAKTLKEARAAFLGFGATGAKLAEHARRFDSGSGSFHIYYCPMAPKPGLWIQANPPLANPFFGASMIGCGEEVEAGGAIDSRKPMSYTETENCSSKPPEVTVGDAAAHPWSNADVQSIGMRRKPD